MNEIRGCKAWLTNLFKVQRRPPCLPRSDLADLYIGLLDCLDAMVGHSSNREVVNK